jgi:flagellar biosynthesis/type III secretory pathway chaperone
VTPSLHPEIESLLDAMESATAELADALVAERTALRGLDVSALESARDLKHRALAGLESCERARAASAARAGWARDVREMGAQLARVADGGALARRWNALSARLRVLRDENRAIGTHLRLHKRHVAETLAVLCGGVHDRDLYGPDGRALQDLGRAPLASA